MTGRRFNNLRGLIYRSPRDLQLCPKCKTSGPFEYEEITTADNKTVFQYTCYECGHTFQSTQDAKSF